MSATVLEQTITPSSLIGFTVPDIEDEKSHCQRLLLRPQKHSHRLGLLGCDPRLREKVQKNRLTVAESPVTVEMFRQTGSYRIDEETGLVQQGTIIRHLLLPNHVENRLHEISWRKETFVPEEIMFSLMR